GAVRGMGSQTDEGRLGGIAALAAQGDLGGFAALAAGLGGFAALAAQGDWAASLRSLRIGRWKENMLHRPMKHQKMKQEQLCCDVLRRIAMPPLP
ncbi:MAG: hypothetical protein IKN55_01855, partial [Oscillospiraceae bacterium]|nr:hypothetical protein [Oscillospiraceae bacterium]